MLVTVGVPLAPSEPVPAPLPSFSLTRARPQPPRVVIHGPSQHFKLGDSLEVARALIAAMQAHGEVAYTERTWYHYNPAEGVFAELTEADVARYVHAFAGATHGAKPSQEDEEKNAKLLAAWELETALAVAEGKKPPAKPRLRQPRLLALNAPFVSSVMTSMATELEDNDFFAAARPGIAFRNGFVEVRPDAIYTLPHSPAHRARFRFGFDYQPAARSERFATFCQEIWRDETPEEIATRHQLYLAFIGVCNLGQATRFGKAIIQFGEGSNGKTTLMDIVTGCMPGPDTVTNVKPQSLEGEYYRDMLAGKLLNAVEEMPEAYIEDTGPMKAAITGDFMLGRAIRKSPRRFRPIAGHLYNANNLPKTSDHTTGFWRRLILVDFKRDFEHGAGAKEGGTRVDMAKHVLEELPAILCEALAAAWYALNAEAYPTPSATTDLMTAWRAENDTIVEFIETCLVPLNQQIESREGWIKSSELYFIYHTWAKQNGHTPYASNKFRQRLQQLKYRHLRSSQGTIYPFQLRGAPTFLPAGEAPRVQH